MLERFGLRKISWKLTALYAAIFSMILILLNAGTLFGVRFFLLQQARNQVQSTSRAAISNLLEKYERNNLSDPDLISESASDPEIRITIADPTGKIIRTSDPDSAQHISFASQLGTVQILERKGRHLLILNSRILSGTKPAAFLQVTYDMHREYEFMKLLFVLMAIADFAGVLFSILAGYFVSRKLLRPIDKLTKTAKAISITDLKSRIDVGRADDELSRLAKTFNEMIDRLQQAFEAQNRFVSDASHELRTPISIIQGYAGLIDRWGKNEPRVLEESITAIRREAESMAALVERLLFLARGDRGSIRIQKEKVDLSALITEVVCESRLIAPSRVIDGETPGQTFILADGKLIKQMLRALVDNAVKYTRESGQVLIRLEKTSSQAVVTVCDNGIGIPAEDLPHIFERFYRVDKARSREQGGSGLGLSIVRWIVEAHQGAVEVTSTPGQGTAFRVELPVSEAV